MERDEGVKRIRDSFSKLVGCTIVDVVVQPSQDYGHNRLDIGLVVEHPLAAAKVKGCGRLVVWASQDAEGNGPGWFEVEEVKS